MAVVRDLPYGNQHFRVDLGAGPQAAVVFAEVVMPDISIDVIEYRTGAAKDSGVQKLPGLARYGNVTLRRGITGALDLYNWIDQVRSGNVNARRTVTITLLSEDLSTVVLTWKLVRAWPVKYSFCSLDAKGSDVAIEELVLAHERLEME